MSIAFCEELKTSSFVPPRDKWCASSPIQGVVHSSITKPNSIVYKYGAVQTILRMLHKHSAISLAVRSPIALDVRTTVLRTAMHAKHDPHAAVRVCFPSKCAQSVLENTTILMILSGCSRYRGTAASQ